jgi:hypothetical protein
MDASWCMMRNFFVMWPLEEIQYDFLRARSFFFNVNLPMHCKSPLLEFAHDLIIEILVPLQGENDR